MPARTPLVFVPNKGAHDYTDAERFGSLRFLTFGLVKKYQTNTLLREIVEGMRDAQQEDYLLVSSLSILNSMCSAVLARRFSRINFLLFSNGKYIERTIVLDNLLDTEDKVCGDDGTAGTQSDSIRDGDG